MANKVEIIVVAKDMTGAVFADVERKAKAAGEKSGKEAGDGIKKGIEDSLKGATAGDVSGTFGAAGQKAGKAFSDGLKKNLPDVEDIILKGATEGLDDVGEPFEVAGGKAGESFTRGIDGKIRDAKGRFVAAGKETGLEIGQAIGDGIETGLGQNNDSGGKSLLSRITGLAGDAVAAGAELGKSVVQGVSDTFSGSGGKLGEAIKTGLIAGAAVGAVIAAPLIASMAAGIIAGGGVLTAAIGAVVAVAVTSPEIQAAGAALGTSLLGGLGDSAQVMVGPVLEAIDSINDRFQQLRPTLDNLFGNTAELIAPLNSALQNFVVSITEGLDVLVEKAGPEVMSGISVGINDLGNALQYMLERFAEIEGLEDGIVAAFAIISETIVLLTDVLATGAEAWESFLNVFRSISEVVEADGLAEKIRAIAEAVREISTGVQDEEGEGVEGVFIKIKEGAEAATGSVGGLSGAIRESINALEELAEAQLAQVDPLVAYNNAIENTQEKQKAYNEAVREHGAASQEAQSAGTELTQAILQQADASAKASEAFKGWTPEMEAAAQAAGLSKNEIDGLRGSVEMTVQELERYKNDWIAKIIMQGAEAAQAGAAGVAAAVNSIPTSKTVTINVVTSGAGLAGLRTGGNASLSPGVGRAASGGVRGNMTLVGEEGPELVRLPFGSSVLTTGASRRAFAEQSAQDRKAAREREEPSGADNADVVTAIYELGRRIESMRLYINERVIGGIQGYEADLYGRAG